MFFKILIPYLVILNLIGFLSMRSDKHKAKTHRRRTPEKRLFAYALLGGSTGCLLGMYLYRHKTKHLSFVIGMPAILLIQTLVLIFGYRYFTQIY